MRLDSGMEFEYFVGKKLANMEGRDLKYGVPELARI